ncbi:HlyD family secretion protein [Paracoccus yeei]|nr:efflux RND transporter periplasmic adaptor subunit [Paracoccus yeei]
MTSISSDLPPSMPARRRSRVLPYVVLLILAALVAGLVWYATRPVAMLVQGEAEAPRVDVSARVPGRVVELGADVGDRVEQGTLLVRLENAQLTTNLGAAQAALVVAQRNETAIGATRPEIIRAREAELAAAEADLQLAQEAATRDRALEQRGVRSQAVIEQSARNLAAAERKVEAAQAQLDLARVGASPEERAVAAAQVDQAGAAIGQAEANIEELNVTAPQSGQVTGRMVELGENVGAGAPLFTIVDLDRTWFTFNIRENLLGGLKVGDRLRVQVPALDAEVDATVTLINAQGDFASWRATRATGDFDLRSFEVRAAPATPVPGLRPGMSALIRPAEAEGE